MVWDLLSEPSLQQSAAKNPSAKLELKDNIVKGDVRIISKTSLSFSFLLNRNTLDEAEQEEKHSKQEGGSFSPVALHAFEVPNQAYVLQPQKKQQPQHFMFFQGHQEGYTH